MLTFLAISLAGEGFRNKEAKLMINPRKASFDKNKKMQKSKSKIKRRKGGKNKIRKNKTGKTSQKRKSEGDMKRKGKGHRQTDCNVDQAYIDYKKASDHVRIIKRADIQFKLINKKSEKLETFESFSRILGLVTDDGTSCTQEAKDGYKFLQNCSMSVPDICTTSDFNISEAETCKIKHKKFLACANNQNKKLCNCHNDYPPEFLDECQAIVDIAGNIANQKKLCLNPDVTGSFSNCMQFVKNDVPTIQEECIKCTNDNTTGTESGTREFQISLDVDTDNKITNCKYKVTFEELTCNGMSTLTGVIPDILFSLDLPQDPNSTEKCKVENIDTNCDRTEVSETIPCRKKSGISVPPSGDNYSFEIEWDKNTKECFIHQNN